MNMTLRHLRIARPVSDLNASKHLYCRALGLEVLGSFEDHAGFDGVMLGIPGLDWHLEFTFCAGHAIQPFQTAEDLLVLYANTPDTFDDTCARLMKSGFRRVNAFNPYWEEHGATFIDHDPLSTFGSRLRSAALICGVMAGSSRASRP